MVTTLGFSIRVELAHHRQGQPPIYAHKVYFRSSFTQSNPDSYSILSLKKSNISRLSQQQYLSDTAIMTPENLDYFFPFIVFFYGLLLVLVLETPALVKIGEERLGAVFQQMSRHKGLAWVCFFVGGLWSIQNVYLTL